MSTTEKISYSLLVPFIVTTFLAWIGLDSSIALFQFFSFLFLVFFAGNSWGAAQANAEEQAKDTLLYVSVGVLFWAVIAWFMPYRLSIIMLLMGFWAVFWVEATPLTDKNFFTSYKLMRWILTIGFSVLHLAMFFVTATPLS